MRASMGGWLEGPPTGAAGENGAAHGSRLGLPVTGSGALAALGRRVVALVIDWVACLAISAAFFHGDPMATLGVFAIENVVLVGMLGTTVGHRLLGLRVVRVVRGVPKTPGPTEPVGQPGLLAGAVRAVLLCLVIPAVVWDADGRGMHDRLAGTVIVRR
jgi:hypothetical protein